VISLIAGGAGFLGSHLADALIQAGDEVIIVDNLSTGNLRNIEQAIHSRRCTFVFCDIAAPIGTLSSVLQPVIMRRRIDRIFHLASPASYEVAQSAAWDSLTVNSSGTLALVELAMQHGAALLYTSDAPNATGPATPAQSAFSVGKRFAEAAVAIGSQTRGLNGKIIRLYNCYGPRMASNDGRLIPSWLAAVNAQQPLPVHGSGLQKRSMTYVSDAVEAMVTVMRDPHPLLEPISFGSGDERTILELARAFAEAAGRGFEIERLPSRPAESQRVKPDLSRARALGCAPRTALDVGLRDTLAWFRRSSASYV